MPRESFFPDAIRPHIHIHRGGVSFTDTNGAHTVLERGTQIRRGVIGQLLEDLLANGSGRSRTISI